MSPTGMLLCNHAFEESLCTPNYPYCGFKVRNVWFLESRDGQGGIPATANTSNIWPLAGASLSFAARRGRSVDSRQTRFPFRPPSDPVQKHLFVKQSPIVQFRNEVTELHDSMERRLWV
jgi:hypothetical protein